MKITNLQRIYLLTGHENLLVEEARAEILTTARAQGFTEQEKYWLEAGFSWQTIINSAASLSLFADKKIIDLRFTRDRAGDGIKEALQSFIELNNPDCLLILSAPKLNKTEQRAAWYKLIADHGAVVTLWPPKATELPTWIQRRAQALDLNLTLPGAKLIADYAQGNLLNAKQSLEKLKLIYGNQALSVANIQASIYDGAKFDVFTLVDTAVSGEPAKTLQILRQLQAEGSEPTFILWALTKDIRLLGNLAFAIRQQHPLAQLLRDANIWESRKPIIQKALQRINLPKTQSLLHQAHSLDTQIKGLKSGNVWDSLTTLCLSLAGVDLWNNIL